MENFSSFMKLIILLLQIFAPYLQKQLINKHEKPASARPNVRRVFRHIKRKRK